jgi:hypothetical protein
VIQIANMVQIQGQREPCMRNVFCLDTCAPIVGANVKSFQKEGEMLEVITWFIALPILSFHPCIIFSPSGVLPPPLPHFPPIIIPHSILFSLMLYHLLIFSLYFSSSLLYYSSLYFLLVSSFYHLISSLFISSLTLELLLVMLSLHAEFITDLIMLHCTSEMGRVYP